MSELKALEALASALSAKVKKQGSGRPVLTLVPTPSESARFDGITRECICKRVRYLARAYRLQWLVDQETFNIPNLECMDDDGLSALLRDMERARECLAEGVAFADAGLVRSNAADLPADD